LFIATVSNCGVLLFYAHGVMRFAPAIHDLPVPNQCQRFAFPMLGS
jgi:hypothetical protein